MASKKIPELDAAPSFSGDDLIIIEKADNSGTYKLTYNQLISAISENVINRTFNNAALANYLQNNGTTTASGYALDAKYGKTLADSISTLNSHWINGQTITSGSFNDIRAAGMYYVGSSVTNSPYGTAYWRLLVIYTGGAPTQFAIENGNDRLYFRRCSNDTWENWVLLSSSKLLLGDVKTFTPTSGSAYSSYGNCYYYKIGSHVHVHVGMNGLTANTDTTVFIMPSGYRPYSTMNFKGENNGINSIASLRIDTSGTVQVRSEGTYAMIDASFDAYS